MSKKRKDAFYAMYNAIQNTLYKLSCGDTIVGDATEKHDAVIEMENALKDAEEVFEYDLAKSMFISVSRKYAPYAKKLKLSCDEVASILNDGPSCDALWATARTILLDRVPSLYQQLK